MMNETSEIVTRNGIENYKIYLALYLSEIAMCI